MKKLIFFIIISLFITGCQKKMSIETIIYDDSNHLTTITYPITNIKKLDKVINDYIDENKKDIEKVDELNIDYTFDIISNRYINISLESFKRLNDKNSFDIKTYIFDLKKNKFLTIDNLVSKNSIDTIDKIINKKTKLKTNYDNVTFDEDNLYFYFNGIDGIKTVSVPTSDTEFLIDLNFQKEIQHEYNTNQKKQIIDPSKPVVALTFDDGPSKYTDDILDILKENYINATFFVIGNKVKYYSNTLNKSIANGNEIGNHTYNHKSLSNLKLDDILSQINKTQDIIYEISGYTPLYLRPSYGNTSHLLKEKTPLEIVLWTVDPEDWKYKNSKMIAKKVLDKTKDGSIILLHDTKKRTRDALKIIIPQLKSKGYQFVTISELKEVQEIRRRTGID